MKVDLGQGFKGESYDSTGDDFLAGVKRRVDEGAFLSEVERRAGATKKVMLDPENADFASVYLRRILGESKP